mgnify:CR=1 FL=1
MSIEVRVSTSVNTLWTCIKVLTEHIVSREQRAIILKLSFLFIVLLTLFRSLTLTHSVYLHCSLSFLSIRLSLCFAFAH